MPVKKSRFAKKNGPQTSKSPAKVTRLKKKAPQGPRPKSAVKKPSISKVKRWASFPKKNSSSPAPATPLAAVAPRYFFNSNIPQTYNEDFICALPRDPEWIFIYWEFTGETLRRIQKKLGPEYRNSKQILRLCDITDIHFNGSNAWSMYDVEINEHANNWYLKVPQPDRTYIVVSGRLLPDGAFTEIMRSNPVAIPRSGISDQTDEEWTTVHTAELLKMSADALRRGVGSSERIMGILPSQLSAHQLNLSSPTRKKPD